ncbi:heavy-metal-associated domain-containing protein, partial [Cupriavidus plantarum]
MSISAEPSVALDAATGAEWSFPVEGMTCASCVRRVENALARVPGVNDASVNLATEHVTLRAESGAALSAAAQAVTDAGYDVPRDTVELSVSDMTCASCVGRVERALRAVP